MSENRAQQIRDLIVVGAGPTAIAIGAEAAKAGIDCLLIDRGPLCGAMVDFPVGMNFFTTRDKLEIASIPFAIPDEKPSRQQALVYYQGVARAYDLDVAPYEEVHSAVRRGEMFVVTTKRRSGETVERRARAVVLATGYFGHPKSLGVPGEELPWVSLRYREPYLHYDQDVVVVGGGNSACEAALDLWRNNVRVTLLVRKPGLKPTVKYWVKPDVENRVAEGAIAAHFEATVEAFRGDGEIVVSQGGATRVLRADAAYVLIGYLPDADLERRCGIELDATTLVPVFDPTTLESNVPGLFVAGTLQAGHDTGKIFIENSRDNGERIVGHLRTRGLGGS